MILKLKALFYKYTGLYFASKEELDYITSNEFWKRLSKTLKHPKNDMSARNVQGLLIGLWQADHGFARPMASVGRFRKPKLFWKTVNWFATLLIVIKWDIKTIFRKFHV